MSKESHIQDFRRSSDRAASRDLEEAACTLFMIPRYQGLVPVVSSIALENITIKQLSGLLPQIFDAET